MYSKQSTKAIASVLLAALVAGCATVPQQQGRQASAPEQDADPCSVGKSALAGAAAGALLGALLDGKKGAMKGAAIGGAAGALGCVAINAQSRQTRTAAQVDQDYVRSRGALPREPQVVSYQPQLSSNIVQRGRPVKITTTAELVNGTATPITEVREELVVFDSHGEQIKSGAKPLVNRSGGRFENTFEVSLPEQASQGIYTMKTNLYINNKLMARRDMNTQLVWDGRNAVIVAGL
ncbi:glycine zipper 2TM domain-containing protein [Duganella sp. PWIR1]